MTSQRTAFFNCILNACISASIGRRKQLKKPKCSACRVFSEYQVKNIKLRHLQQPH